jgi:hypothetical protein
VLGDRLEKLIRLARGEIASVRDRLDVVARVKARVSERPLPFLAGGLTLGYALGATAPAAVKVLGRAGLVSLRLAVRIGGPIALIALLAGERGRPGAPRSRVRPLVPSHPPRPIVPVP